MGVGPVQSVTQGPEPTRALLGLKFYSHHLEILCVWTWGPALYTLHWALKVTWLVPHTVHTDCSFDYQQEHRAYNSPSHPECAQSTVIYKATGISLVFLTQEG